MAAVVMVQRLLELFRTDKARQEGFGRRGLSVRLDSATLSQRPLTSTKQFKHWSGLSFPSASKTIETLVDLCIAREITGRRNNPLVTSSDAYLAILSEGTEPVSSFCWPCCLSRRRVLVTPRASTDVRSSQKPVRREQETSPSRPSERAAFRSGLTSCDNH